MSSLGPTEIILILVAVLLLFGAKRLPEIGRSFGKGLREFKKATTDISDTLVDEALNQKDSEPDKTNKTPQKTVTQD